MMDRIVSGDIPPGAPLHQGVLAQELGLNRHQVREILKTLATERLVQIRPYATARVTPLSADEFQELHELRIALEASVVRRALPRLTGLDISTMRRCVDELTHPADSAARLQAHEQFHSLLYGRADRPWMVALIDQSRTLSRRYLALLHDEIGWPSTAASHERILRAVEEGDIRLAEQLIADHGREAHDPVFRYLANRQLEYTQTGS